ncbi:MAG: class I SAM-dependent methyltransferase [Limisphaerales bacterium]
MDIGCGPSSVLTQFRPGLRTVGLDAFEGAISEARKRAQHDDYVLADVLSTSPETILERSGGRPFDLVTLFHVIEHFPKRQAFELLERCERLTCKYILVVTPNGFLEQGPEYGNEFQRHLSGWFTHDFEGLGYSVRGVLGARYFAATVRCCGTTFPGPPVVMCCWRGSCASKNNHTGLSVSSPSRTSGAFRRGWARTQTRRRLRIERLTLTTNPRPPVRA